MTGAAAAAVAVAKSIEHWEEVIRSASAAVEPEGIDRNGGVMLVLNPLPRRGTDNSKDQDYNILLDIIRSEHQFPVRHLESNAELVRALVSSKTTLPSIAFFGINSPCDNEAIFRTLPLCLPNLQYLEFSGICKLRAPMGPLIDALCHSCPLLIGFTLATPDIAPAVNEFKPAQLLRLPRLQHLRLLSSAVENLSWDGFATALRRNQTLKSLFVWAAPFETTIAVYHSIAHHPQLLVYDGPSTLSRAMQHSQSAADQLTQAQAEFLRCNRTVRILGYLHATKPVVEALQQHNTTLLFANPHELHANSGDIVDALRRNHDLLRQQERLSTIWKPASLTIAFLRANAAHPFQAVIYQPDLLLVILQFAASDSLLLDLRAANCIRDHIHAPQPRHVAATTAATSDAAATHCDEFDHNEPDFSLTTLQEQMEEQQQQLRGVFLKKVQAFAASRYARSIIAEARAVHASALPAR